MSKTDVSSNLIKMLWESEDQVNKQKALIISNESTIREL